MRTKKSIFAIWPVFLLCISGLQGLWAEEDSEAHLEYLKRPEKTSPLEHLLPSKGVLSTESGLLRVPSKNLAVVHEVDYQNREVKISKWYHNSSNGSSTKAWDAWYTELGNYAYDLNELGLRKAWLNSLIGVESADSISDSQFEIEVPYSLPPWLKDFGLSKPKLEIKGEMRFWVSGGGSKTVYKSTADDEDQSRLIPSFNPHFDGNYEVNGKIGRYVTITVKNSGELGVKNEVKVTYKENEKGEFEDHILQEIEAGTTQLDLPGTELTGYSESHKGLFGIKAKFKVGDLYITTIASQEGGSQENYTLRSQAEDKEFIVRDKEFVSYRHYFRDEEHRTDYARWKLSKSSSELPTPSNFELYVLETSSTKEGSYDLYYYDGNREDGVAQLNVTMRLLTQKKDYTLDKGGLITLKSRSASMILAGRWVGDNVSVGSDRKKLRVIKWKDEKKSYLRKLMLKNRYDVGWSEETASSFRLDMETSDKRRGNYMKVLGLITGTETTIDGNDADLFDDKTKELILPCTIDSAGVSSADSINICLEPFRKLENGKNIYDVTLSELKGRKFQSKYNFLAFGRTRSNTIRLSDSYSVNSGGCIDIAEGSEKLKMGSTTLQKGTDYEVLYELGQIELISERAQNPNEEIEVSYECEPLFRIDNKLLMGIRTEYFFESLGEGSLFGTTLLYKSQSTTASRPQAGQEPFHSTLFGANLRLQDNAKWMDAFINGIPLIYSKQKSKWALNLEMAYAWHNPNSKGSALVDDFESSKRELPFSLRRQSWKLSSPPGGVKEDLFFREDEDYRHMGEFIWSSNSERYFFEIYNETNSSQVNTDRIRPLTLQLTPNDDLLGQSWGGIMRSNSEYYSTNMAEMEYIEIVVQGRNGDLFLDFGSISEDVSINGAAPNNDLNSELSTADYKEKGDFGLDGLVDGETRIDWTCYSNGCDSTLVTESETGDVGLDNFDDDQRDQAFPNRSINGTEGNKGDAGGSDTEDLNKDRSLNTTNEFIRYRIPLHQDSLDLIEGVEIQELNNGWRKIAIPLQSFHELVPSTSDFSELILSVPYTRLWLGNLPEGVSDARVQIARFSVIGNAWEEGSVSEDGTTSQAQTIKTEDGSIIENVQFNTATAPPDSHFVKVRVVNNRDDIGRYFTSPNTETEYSRSDNSPLKEQSLVLRYGNLEAGEQVFVTRLFDNEFKDFTGYKDLKMEIHLDSVGRDALGKYNQDNVRFAIQIGHGDLVKGEAFYEWSFRPKAKDCEKAENVGECNNLNWYRNAFEIKLQNWPALKNTVSDIAGCSWTRENTDTLRAIRQNGAYQCVSPTDYQSKLQELTDLANAEAADNQFRLPSERAEAIAMIGNPSLSRINWMRFVVIADEQVNTTDNKAHGEIWINDMRLDGVNEGAGLASRASLQLDFGDVMTLSGEVEYREGDFATLTSNGSSPLPSRAEMNSKLEAKADFTFQLNKFFPDDWKMAIPLGLGYSSVVNRPYVEPLSDRELSEDTYRDFTDDLLQDGFAVNDNRTEDSLRRAVESKGFQSFTTTKRFSIAYKKEHVKNRNFWQEYFTQIFWERPSANYAWSNSHLKDTRSIDTTRTYQTTFEYKLGQLGSKSRGFNWWPETMDLRLLDLNFRRRHEIQRDLEGLRKDTIVDYTLDLRQRLKSSWSIFPFLRFNFDVDIKRDMTRDHSAYTWGRFIEDNGENRSARRSLFAFNDRAYRFTRNSNGEIIGADQTKLGKEYLFLRNENDRKQNLSIAFNPSWVSFLTLKTQFKTKFDNKRRISRTFGNDFESGNFEDADDQYWTLSRSTAFEFKPTLRFKKLFKWSKGMTSFLKTYGLSSLRFTWSAKLDTKGENYTLAHLENPNGLSMSPGEFYLYSLGLGDGEGFRNFYDIISGDKNKTNPGDYQGFAEYNSLNVDSLADQDKFTHKIERKAQWSTQVTIPWMKIRSGWTLDWKEQIEQVRAEALFTDTITTWPKITVSNRVPNFAKRWKWSKKKLKSLTLNNKVVYEAKEIKRPNRAEVDEYSTKWSLDPILKISMTTKKKMTIENAIKVTREKGYLFSKIAPPTYEALIADTSSDFSKRVENLPLYASSLNGLEQIDGQETNWDAIRPSFYEPPFWLQLDRLNINERWLVGNKFHLGYQLPTNKGIQFWKWFVRLKNPIKLDTYFDAERIQEDPRRFVYDGEVTNVSDAASLQKEFDAESDKSELEERFKEEVDENTSNKTVSWYFSFKQQASYQFTKSVDGSAFMAMSYRNDSRGKDLKDGEHKFNYNYEVRVVIKF